MEFLEPYEFTLTNLTSIDQTDISLLFPANNVSGFTRQQASDTSRQSVTGQSWGAGIGVALVVPHTLYQVPTDVKVFKSGVDITSQFTISNLTASSVTLTKTVVQSVSSATVRFYGNPPVKATYDVSGQTYLSMLYDIMTNPSLFGCIYLQSQSISQLNKSWTVIQYNVRGKQQQQTFFPVVNPFQRQTTSLFTYPVFVANGFTDLVLSTLKANESLSVKIYPINYVDRDVFIGVNWSLLREPQDYYDIPDGLKFLKPDTEWGQQQAIR